MDNNDALCESLQLYLSIVSFVAFPVDFLYFYFSTTIPYDWRKNKTYSFSSCKTGDNLTD